MPREYTRPRPTTRTRCRPASPARDRGRLIIALDGRTWLAADDLETERELRDLSARLAEVLVAHVGGAA